VHYLDEMTYASSLSSLSMYSASSPQVTVEIVHADAQGWSAAGRHTRALGRSCTIWTGAAEPLATDHDGRVGGEAEVVCDAAGEEASFRLPGPEGTTPPPTDLQRAWHFVRDLERQARSLVRAQGRYWQMTGRYARDLTDLESLPAPELEEETGFEPFDYTPPDWAEIELLSADAGGWSAAIAHAGLVGWSCGLRYGEAPIFQTAREGRAVALGVVCDGDELLVRAQAFRDSAEFLFELGADVMPDLADWLAERGEDGRTAIDQALGLIKSAAALRDSIADVDPEYYQILAGQYAGMQYPDSLIKYANRYLRVTGDSEPYGAATFLEMVAMAHQILGRPDSSAIYHNLALGVFRAIGDRAGQAGVLESLAMDHLSLGRSDSSLVYMARASEMRGTLGSSDAELIATSAGLLARAEFDSAAVYLERAVTGLRGAGAQSELATALYLLASVYGEMEDWDRGIGHLVEAYELDQGAGNVARSGLALFNASAWQLRAERPDSAEIYLNRTRAHYAGVLAEGGEPPAVPEALGRVIEANALFLIGLARRARGQPDSALAYMAEAVEIGRRTPGVPVWMFLTDIGVTHHRFHPEGDLEKAVAYYDSAAIARSSQRAHAGDDLNRLSLGEQEVGLFEGWALAQAVLSERRGGASWALVPLGVAEGGRAQALLDLMREPAPDSEVTREAGRITPGTDPTAELARLDGALRGPRSAGLYYLATSDTLLIWSLLPGGEVTLDRVPITRDSLASSVASLRIDLGVEAGAPGARLSRGEEALEATRSESVRRGGEGGPWLESASDLAALLLPSALMERLGAVDEVTVFPHGPLNLLPFGLLPVDEEDTPLGVRVAVRYSPSIATLLIASGSGAVFAGPGPAAPAEDRGREPIAAPLVVGNPAMPTVTAVSGETVVLEPLPGAGREAAAVAGRFGASSITGADATERAIRESLPEADLVHLATHGFAYSSEGRSRDSFIALASDDEHDGVLTVGEILDGPRLAARLVVLSACQTALGNLRQAEGTVGLQRAFLARGAGGVLVSQWSVSDRATELLMDRFYGHWLEDEDLPGAAEALRRAQEDVRATEEFEHPRFWAAFQLVGAR
jgi:tetratricopeptide (TPR) repeat protein